MAEEGKRRAAPRRSRSWSRRAESSRGAGSGAGRAGRTGRMRAFSLGQRPLGAPEHGRTGRSWAAKQARRRRTASCTGHATPFDLARQAGVLEMSSRPMKVGVPDPSPRILPQSCRWMSHIRSSLPRAYRTRRRSWVSQMSLNVFPPGCLSKMASPGVPTPSARCHGCPAPCMDVPHPFPASSVHWVSPIPHLPNPAIRPQSRPSIPIPHPTPSSPRPTGGGAWSPSPVRPPSTAPGHCLRPGGQPSCPVVKRLTQAPPRRSLATRVATTSWGMWSRENPTDGVPRSKFHGRHTTLSASTQRAADAEASRTGGRRARPGAELRAPGNAQAMHDSTDPSWNEHAALRSTAALSPGPGHGGAPRQQHPPPT